MSLKKHQVWAMMPLLGILFMSPDDVSVKYGRGLASQEPAPEVQTQQPQAQESRPASQTPKLDALVATLTVPERQNPVNLNGDHLKEEITSLLSRADAAEQYQRTSATQEQVTKHRNELRESAISLVQVEKSIKDLLNPEDGEEVLASIKEAKIRLEASIADLEESERVVAARTATPAETPVVATSTPAPAPEQPERSPSVVTEETKPEPTPTTVETKPESKPEPKPESTEKDPILCALEEQNKLLQQQLQGFVQQQSMIMQQLMSLTQLVMMQNMYRTPDTFNYQQAYQYHQPQVAGNWVYYPNGLQPIQPGQTMPGQPDQSSIFGAQQQQPQFNPYMMGQQQPQFPFSQPGMMNQGGMWGLGSQMQFQHNPGNFGMDALGFNFGNSPVAPSQQSPMFNSGFQFI